MIEKNKCILVVDDNPAICRLVAEVFKNSEFEVLEAQDGMEALIRLNTTGKKPIDILLTDVIMPRLNGAELARIALDRHAATKIIFMSGQPEEVVSCFGIPQSNMHYINKPFTAETLERMIRDLKK